VVVLVIAPHPCEQRLVSRMEVAVIKRKPALRQRGL